MKTNLVFLACFVCIAVVIAVPVPSNDESNLEVLQIPLQGNRVSKIINTFI